MEGEIENTYGDSEDYFNDSEKEDIKWLCLGILRGEFSNRRFCNRGFSEVEEEIIYTFGIDTNFGKDVDRFVKVREAVKGRLLDMKGGYDLSD